MSTMAGADEDEKKVEAFLRWAAEVGVSDASAPTECNSSMSNPSCLGHSLLLSHFPDAGGRGLAAARELRRGALILRVPRAALLTRENVLRDEKLTSCFSRHAHLSPTQLLTVCLLAEVGKGKASLWYPYLIQLPRSYDTLANFTQFEIQAFQVDDAIGVAEKAALRAQLDWKQSLILMQEIKLKTQLRTFKSWLWASATVSSRALHIPWDCAGCLCPVGDLFNYAAPEDDSEDMQDRSSRKCNDTDEKAHQFEEFSGRLTDGGFEEGIDSYCFYARKRYVKGDQVLLSYGTYTNLELLEHYGFLLNTNPNDKSFIQLDAVVQISSSWPKESLYIQEDGKPSFALMSALRLWATPRNLRRAVGHLAHSGCQLSVENEMSVMQFVLKKCQYILEKLKTSAEDDGRLLDMIEKMLVTSSSCMDDGLDLLSCSCEELRDFLQVNGLTNGSSVVSALPPKAKRSMERWRLAVQWRSNYKKVLLLCIAHCNEVLGSSLL